MIRLGWSALKDDWIRSLGETEFEEFCRALVDAEHVVRWRPREVDVQGPSVHHLRDGGVDVLVEFRAPPSESLAAWVRRTGGPRTLLGDGQAGEALVISCKAGAGWEKSAKKDAKKGSERAIEFLKSGARWMLLTTQFCPSPPKRSQASTKKSPVSTKKSALPKLATRSPQAEKTQLRRELAEAYALRTGIAAATLFDRIDILDGHDLGAYVRALKPTTLPEQWTKAAGVREFPLLMPFEKWAKHDFTRSKGLIAWSDDPDRTSKLQQVVGFLDVAGVDAQSPVRCIVGPPGIGKTRFVAQSFISSGRERLGVCCNDPDAFEGYIIGGLMENAPDALYVVDDCTPEQVVRLARRFQIAASRDDDTSCKARLLLVCPTASVRDLSDVDLVQLGPLQEEASCEIIRAATMRPLDEEKVRRIHALTEGYPWFAVLVARDPEGREVTTSGDAARRAIGGGDYAETQSLARAHLAVMLVRSARWIDLDTNTRERLALAVGLANCRELMKRLKECEARGVVRQTAHEGRYVTPFVLEREVWNLLNDGGPDEPIGRLIVAHCPERVAKLLERLRDVGVDVGSLMRTTGEVSRTLLSGDTSLAAIEASPLLPALRLCAEVAPEQTLKYLAACIERSSLDELRAQRGLRRTLIAAFRLIVRDGASFSPLESALFRLTLAENEVYTDRATSMWAWLFLPWVWPRGPVHEERLAIAERRCLYGSEEERAVAVRGLALTPSQWVMHRDTNWESDAARRPDSDAIRKGYSALWRLLLQCARSNTGAGVDEAQVAVVEHLQMAIGAHLLDDLEGPLLAVLRALPEALRLKVRRNLEMDRRRLARSNETFNGIWGSVDRETRGRSFVERLRERVRAPWATRDDDRAAEIEEDSALIREGLAEPACLLRASLGELDGGPRTPRLTILVGRLDVNASLVGTLVERARDATRDTLLAFYCVGHAEAERREFIDRWLDEWSSDPTLVRAVVETIVRVGPDDRWLDRLRKMLTHGDLRTVPLNILGWGRWERTSAEARTRLLSAMAESDHPDAAFVILDRLGEGERDLTDEEADALSRALAATSLLLDNANQEWAFARAGERLLAAGRGAIVATSALRASVAVETPSSEILLLVSKCAECAPNELLDALTAILAKTGQGRDRVVGALGWYDVLGHLPVERIMMWAGEDPGRGESLARILRGEGFPPLARALIARFGAHSSVASVMTDGFLEPDGNVRDFTAFYEARRALVERCASQEVGAARVWLDDVRERLDRLLRERRGTASSAQRRAG